MPVKSSSLAQLPPPPPPALRGLQDDAQITPQAAPQTPNATPRDASPLPTTADGIDEPSPALPTRDPLMALTGRGRALVAEVHGSPVTPDRAADSTGMAMTVAGEATSLAGVYKGGAALVATEFLLGATAVGATVVSAFTTLGGAHLDGLKANVAAGAKEGYSVGVALELLGQRPNDYRDSSWGQPREERGKTEAFNGAMREGIEAVRNMSPADREAAFQALLDDVRQQVPLTDDNVLELARAVRRYL